MSYTASKKFSDFFPLNQSSSYLLIGTVFSLLAYTYRYVDAVSRRLTHPFSFSSHIGFLRKYVKHLKDMKFLREDLVFSNHSEEVIWCQVHFFVHVFSLLAFVDI